MVTGVGQKMTHSFAPDLHGLALKWSRVHRCWNAQQAFQKWAQAVVKANGISCVYGFSSSLPLRCASKKLRTSRTACWLVRALESHPRPGRLTRDQPPGLCHLYRPILSNTASSAVGKLERPQTVEAVRASGHRRPKLSNKCLQLNSIGVRIPLKKER